MFKVSLSETKINPYSVQLFTLLSLLSIFTIQSKLLTSPETGIWMKSSHREIVEDFNRLFSNKILQNLFLVEKLSSHLLKVENVIFKSMKPKIAREKKKKILILASSCISISFWVESSFPEASVATECPEASVSASVVEAAFNGIGYSSSTSQLPDIIIKDEACFTIEKTKSGVDASEIAWSWSFSFENFVAVLSDKLRADSKLSDALTTSWFEIFLSLDNEARSLMEKIIIKWWIRKYSEKS